MYYLLTSDHTTTTTTTTTNNNNNNNNNDSISAIECITSEGWRHHILNIYLTVKSQKASLTHLYIVFINPVIKFNN
ncbi:unnamed protein product [Schistosoma mattheei]|uniref:Uncharacterized protein n=1 Tax=Schistosoma mattheei TaxID=31246 RepID=A0A183PMU5_9TREM|nr:unnamed protein product [Schistosoma mattheei]